MQPIRDVHMYILSLSLSFSLPALPAPPLSVSLSLHDLFHLNH
jgi:hypothetical protein